MKTRVLSILMCLVLLMSVFSTSVSAVTPTVPTGVQTTTTVQASMLPYTVSYGTTDGKTMTAAVPFDEAAQDALQVGSEGITTDSATGIPYQLFEIDTSGAVADTIAIALHASTIQNERMALKVFNTTTNVWDTVDTAVSNGYLSADVALSSYADSKGLVKALVMPDYVANGSNRFLWSTDQQHYTKFDDLHQTYYDIHNYVVSEYQKDATAYLINTGDIVDDRPNSAAAAKEWVVADKAFAILDDANVPYGIVTGNHDVGDFPINNYSDYLKYFTEDRYTDKAWYGGTPDNNKCHYDLVTVGNVDFIILYLGYGQGQTEEVIDWCNEVLQMYPHRTAIIATHQYLRPTTLEHEGRADNIHEKVVTQNDNVLMVLCGHYDGAGYKAVTLDDGRVVYEVIADYQFVQKEDESYYKGVKDPTHAIGSVTGCNGEGYIREVIIEGDTVSMYAFSPVTGGEKPFGQRDEFALTVDFPEATRSITTYRFAAAITGEGDESLTKWTYDDGSTDYAVLPEGAYSEAALTVYADKDNLQTLIDRASSLDKTLYTTDSFTAMTTVLNTAKTAVSGDTDTIREAYASLSNAVGALVKFKKTINKNDLIMLHEFDLQKTSWKNGSGVESLSYEKSYVTFENNENGGFTAKKGAAPNNWPDIHYKNPVVFTPVDGKVYLYLDIEAGSTWSLFPVFIQNGQQYSGRLNSIIEGSYNETFDAGSGRYYGVYDVTDALVNMGLNLNEQIIMTFVMNVVPGPITVNEIALLTGEELPQSTFTEITVFSQKLDKNAYTEDSYNAFQKAMDEFKKATDDVAKRAAYKKALAAKNALVTKATEDDTDSSMMMIIIIVAVVAVVLVVGFLLFAIFFKPKKKDDTTAEQEEQKDDQEDKTE